MSRYLGHQHGCLLWRQWRCPLCKWFTDSDRGMIVDTGLSHRALQMAAGARVLPWPGETKLKGLAWRQPNPSKHVDVAEGVNRQLLHRRGRSSIAAVLGKVHRERVQSATGHRDWLLDWGTPDRLERRTGEDGGVHDDGLPPGAHREGADGQSV
jgi:hypothetical protein